MMPPCAGGGRVEVGELSKRGWRVAAAYGLLALAACAGAAPLHGEVPPAEIVMQGERLFPESISSDADGTLYIGSNPGIVFRAVPGSSVAVPWIVPDAENGLQTVFGVLADDLSGLLWVCSNPAMGQAGSPAIKVFRLDDGSFEGSFPFPDDAGPAMCNDMTFDDDWNVYASETLGGRIMFMRNGSSSFEVWASDPELASIDGISFGPGGRLFANAIQRNTLLEILRHADGSFDRVEVLATSQALAGPDGLRPLDEHRMLQSEGNAGTITVLTFTDDGPVQIETIAEGVDYASSVTASNGRAFYPEGKLRFLFGPMAGQDPGPFVIRSVAIPEGE